MTQIMQAEHLLSLSDSLLNKKPDEHSWSIAQVAEHLNTYSTYYLPRISMALASASKTTVTDFKPGWLGNYFVGMMQPDNGIIKKKYKAAARHRPGVQLNSHEVLTTYITHQKQLITLLEQARSYDINKLHIPISIAPFIKLKLGDVFRFIVAHQQRHTLQMHNILATVNS